MSVAKVIEVSSSSPVSFDDAVEQGIMRTCKTVEGVKGAWIQEQTLVVENNQVIEYRVNMKVTFVLND